MAQLIKNPPAMWETWVQSLGLEDPPEKGMVTHSSILEWRIPRRNEQSGSKGQVPDRVPGSRGQRLTAGVNG